MKVKNKCILITKEIFTFKIIFCISILRMRMFHNSVYSLFNYMIASCTGMFIITYFLNIPHLVTGQPQIVNEYYQTNHLKNIPLDFMFVLLYLLLAHILIKIFNIQSKLVKILIVALITTLLTGFFCYLFLSKEVIADNFFSKWFHTVGYKSVIYDAILLVFIYMIYIYLEGRK